MITNINEILAEWAFRTKSGILNPKSMAHQILLEGILKDYGWSMEARAELLNNLITENRDLVPVYNKDLKKWTNVLPRTLKNNPDKYSKTSPDGSGPPAHIAKDGEDKTDPWKKLDTSLQRQKAQIEGTKEVARTQPNKKKILDQYFNGRELKDLTDDERDEFAKILNLELRKYKGEFDAQFDGWLDDKEENHGVEDLFEKFLNLNGRLPDDIHPSAKGFVTGKKSAGGAVDKVRQTIKAVGEELDKHTDKVKKLIDVCKTLEARDKLNTNEKNTLKSINNAHGSCKELESRKDDHQKVKGYFNKIMSGEILTEKEQKLFNQYIQSVEPPESSDRSAKFYLALGPNRWNRQRSPKAERVFVGSKGHESVNTEMFNKWLASRGVGQIKTSYWGGKKTTPNQAFRGKDGKVKLLNKKKSKVLADKESGKVTGVEIGGMTINIIDTSKMDSKTEEDRIRINRAEISNRNVETIAAALRDDPPMTFIDMDQGVFPDSADNRVTVIQSALSGMAKRLRQLDDSYDITKHPSPAAKTANQIIKNLEDFATTNPNDNPAEWRENLTAIMSQIANHNRKESGTLVDKNGIFIGDKDFPSLSEAWANYAEIFETVIQMQGDGKGTASGACALLPESTTLETIDVLNLTESGEGEQIIVTLDGVSVKAGIGGPSALTSKTTKSTYHDDPDGNIKATITSMSNQHDKIYSRGLDTATLDEQKELQKANQDKLEADARSVGVSDEYIEDLNTALEEPDGEAYKKVMSALEGKDGNAGIKRARKNEKLDTSDDTMDKIKERLIAYYRYCKLAHRAYNQNVKSQDFFNASFIAQGVARAENKDVEIDVSDGVTTLAYPGCEFNIGFDTEGRSTNPGGGRFHNEKKAERDKRYGR